MEGNGIRNCWACSDHPLWLGHILNWYHVHKASHKAPHKTKPCHKSSAITLLCTIIYMWIRREMATHTYKATIAHYASSPCTFQTSIHYTYCTPNQTPTILYTLQFCISYSSTVDTMNRMQCPTYSCCRPVQGVVASSCLPHCWIQLCGPLQASLQGSQS